MIPCFVSLRSQFWAIHDLTGCGTPCIYCCSVHCAVQYTTLYCTLFTDLYRLYFELYWTLFCTLFCHVRYTLSCTAQYKYTFFEFTKRTFRDFVLISEPAGEYSRPLLLREWRRTIIFRTAGLPGGRDCRRIQYNHPYSTLHIYIRWKHIRSGKSSFNETFHNFFAIV